CADQHWGRAVRSRPSAARDRIPRSRFQDPGRHGQSQHSEFHRDGAWASYYTPEHARTIFCRAAACKASRPEMTLWTVAFFFRTIEVEGVQPLEGGAFRLKFRRDRRSGMRLESPLVFYPRYVWDSARRAW